MECQNQNHDLWARRSSTANIISGPTTVKACATHAIRNTSDLRIKKMNEAINKIINLIILIILSF